MDELGFTIVNEPFERSGVTNDRWLVKEQGGGIYEAHPKLVQLWLLAQRLSGAQAGNDVAQGNLVADNTRLQQENEALKNRIAQLEAAAQEAANRRSTSGSGQHNPRKG